MYTYLISTRYGSVSRRYGSVSTEEGFSVLRAAVAWGAPEDTPKFLTEKVAHKGAQTVAARQLRPREMGNTPLDRCKISK